MKQIHFKTLIVFFLFIYFSFISHCLAADTLETFSNPLGCAWGTLNTEPDNATAIAKTSDGFIISGYVPGSDYDPNHPDDRKGGYGIIYRLNETGARIFYRSYVYDTNFHCDPDICVTCGSVDVSDYTSHVSLFSNKNYWGGCTTVSDVAVLSPGTAEEEYVLLGSRLTPFPYPDPEYPWEDLFTHVPGVWLAKTDTIGNLTLDVGYADHFDQQFDPDGIPLHLYSSVGTSLTPIWDYTNNHYDFLIGANLLSNIDHYGWLFKADNSGTIESEHFWFVAWAGTGDFFNSPGGHGVTEFFETDDGYLVSHDRGVWGLDPDYNRTLIFNGGVHGYRSMIKEGTDTIVVTTLDDGDENYPALVKIDNTGYVIWSRTFDCTEQQCELVKVVRTDYGYVVVGSTTMKGYGGLDVWLVATDLDGTRLWDKSLGGTYNDKGVDLLFIPGAAQEDDDALVVAAIASFDTDDLKGPEAHSWVVKTRDRFYPPEADFTWAPEPVIVEQMIAFTATASDPNDTQPDGTIERYDWDFGDGTQRIDGNPSEPHSFATPGEYEVKLSVWDNDGVETIVKKIVTVDFLTIQWQRFFDNNRYWETCTTHESTNSMAGYDMVETSDGGLAIIGRARFCDNTQGFDPWLMKTDDRGMFLWQQDFIGYGHDPNPLDPGNWGQGAGLAIAEDGSGAFILTGYINKNIPYHTDTTDFWVAKTSSVGTPLWYNVLDNGFVDQGNDIVIMDDGYFISGHQFKGAITNSFDAMAWLAKFDFDGNYLVDESVIMDNSLSFETITRVDDGDGLLMTGHNIHGGDPVWLFYTDNSGAADWSINFGEDSPSNMHHYFGHWADQANDGNYLVAGSQYDQLFIAKTDGSPGSGWETIIPDQDPNTLGVDRILTGVKTPDGGYLMGATMKTEITYNSDFNLIKFNDGGEELWRWVPNNGPDNYGVEDPQAIISHSDGSYTILINREIGNNGDVWLIKIGPSQDPIAAFEADQTSESLPFEVTFTDMSSNGSSPYSYEWDFGDGGASTDTNPVHTYTVTGQYTVSLTITDTSDREDIYVRNLYITAGMPDLAGDIDADGDVDGHDLYLLQQAMNSEPGDDNWNPNADLNGDGIINEQDLENFADYFGGVEE